MVKKRNLYLLLCAIYSIFSYHIEAFRTKLVPFPKTAAPQYLPHNNIEIHRSLKATTVFRSWSLKKHSDFYFIKSLDYQRHYMFTMLYRIFAFLYQLCNSIVHKFLLHVASLFHHNNPIVNQFIQNKYSSIPICIFVNSKSGGLNGKRFVENMKLALPADKICDLSYENPSTKLLSAINNYARYQSCDDEDRDAKITTKTNDDMLTEAQHSNAPKVVALCCGGDGTMKWIMDEAKKLNVSSQVLFGLIPLGTGNDLFNHIMSDETLKQTSTEDERRYHYRRSVHSSSENYTNEQQWMIQSFLTTTNALPNFVAETLALFIPPNQQFVWFDRWTAKIVKLSDYTPVNISSESTELGHTPFGYDRRDGAFISLPADDLSNDRVPLINEPNHAPVPLMSSSTHKLTTVKSFLHTMKQEIITNVKNISISPYLSKLIPQSTVLKTIHFNNYLGIGIDGEISFTFDDMRRHSPHLFFHRLINQFWYGMIWLYKFLHFTRKVGVFTSSVELYCDNQAIDLKKHDLSGIIVTNIGSYAGGCKLWDSMGKEWSEQHSDDGCIEVI